MMVSYCLYPCVICFLIDRLWQSSVWLLVTTICPFLNPLYEHTFYSVAGGHLGWFRLGPVMELVGVGLLCVGQYPQLYSVISNCFPESLYFPSHVRALCHIFANTQTFASLYTSVILCFNHWSFNHWYILIIEFLFWPQRVWSQWNNLLLTRKSSSSWRTWKNLHCLSYWGTFWDLWKITVLKAPVPSKKVKIVERPPQEANCFKSFLCPLEHTLRFMAVFPSLVWTCSLLWFPDVGLLLWFVLGNGTSECYYFHENCFLMGTIAKACLQGSDLLVQQHFRWVQLRWDGEPMQGLLRRFLRRKVVNKVTDHTWPVVGRGSLTFPGIAVRQPGLELCHLLCGFWHVKIRGRQGSSGASLVAETVKNLPAVQEIWVCRRYGFAGDSGSVPGSGRSPGGGLGNPLQYSCLENPLDRGTRRAAVRGVIKSWTQLSN